MYGYDIIGNHKINFKCYQGAYKDVDLYYDMVVADEIHDGLSPKYFNFFKNNKYKHLIGLSATIDGQTMYDIDGEEISKTDLLNRVAPIVFKYGTNDGQKDDTARKLFVFVINHELNRTNKTIEKEYIDKKTKEKATFSVTEADAYNYAHTQFLQQIYKRDKKPFLINYWSNARASILYKLQSKNLIIKDLLQYLDRTIVFGNNIDTLTEICPVVSSKMSKEDNMKLIQDFNSGIVNTIGSFKMLKQGITLSNLNNVIFHSYYKSQKDAIQRWGRLRKADTPGYVFIFKTLNTQEEKWYTGMMEGLDQMTIINCTSNNVIEKLKKLKSESIN